MDWSQQIYLTAGLGALVLGGGVLLREPGRKRNRHFALLCGALAVWTLGVLARKVSGDPDFPWHRIFLLGSCAAAPLGLHFSLVVARQTGRLHRTALPIAYAVALALWVSAWTPLRDNRGRWNVIALLILSGILLVALVVLFRNYRTVPPGPSAGRTG